jgi:uncharacterized protein involved in exopolysaccharide biosynthesis
LVTLRHVGAPIPRKLQEWVNALADVYVKRNVDQATTSFRAIMDEIQREMTKFRRTSAPTISIACKERPTSSCWSPKRSKTSFRQTLGTYNDSLAKLNVEIAALRAEVDSYDRARRQAAAMCLTVASVAQDPMVQDLVGQRQPSRRNLRQIGTDKKPGHPAYLAKLEELDKIKQRLDNQSNRSTAS